MADVGNSEGTSGKVALVTGSVRGLGLAVARGLRERGDRVHVVYRSSKGRAGELEAEFGGRIHRADLLAEGDAERLVAGVLQRDGRLDYAVHAMGEYTSGPLSELAPGDFRRMFASNAESAFHFMRACRAPLREAGREAGGRMVFFGCAGLAGLRARRMDAAYTAAKSALLVLARSMAVEEAPFGVTVNMISPGWIPHDAAHPDTFDVARSREIPAGRTGTPEEIAEAVAWLCSDASRYTTGADVPVAGGWML